MKNDRCRGVMFSLNDASLQKLDALKEASEDRITRASILRELIHKKWAAMRRKEGLEGAKQLREEWSKK